MLTGAAAGVFSSLRHFAHFYVTFLWFYGCWSPTTWFWFPPAHLSKTCNFLWALRIPDPYQLTCFWKDKWNLQKYTKNCCQPWNKCALQMQKSQKMLFLLSARSRGYDFPAHRQACVCPPSCHSSARHQGSRASQLLLRGGKLCSV